MYPKTPDIKQGKYLIMLKSGVLKYLFTKIKITQIIYKNIINFLQSDFFVSKYKKGKIIYI